MKVFNSLGVDIGTISEPINFFITSSDDLLLRPGCVGKVECVYDDATEGVGTLMRDKFFIDWLDDDGWIDDLLTIDGNEMTGDDGNGLIRLVKEE